MERCASFSASVDVNTCFQKKPDRQRGKQNEENVSRSRQGMTSSLSTLYHLDTLKGPTHGRVEFTHTHQEEKETAICGKAG